MAANHPNWCHSDRMTTKPKAAGKLPGNLQTLDRFCALSPVTPAPFGIGVPVRQNDVYGCEKDQDDKRNQL